MGSPGALLLLLVDYEISVLVKISNAGYNCRIFKRGHPWTTEKKCIA